MNSVSSFGRGLLLGLVTTFASLAIPGPAHAASTTLVVGGTPPSSVILGQYYTFKPTASDTVVSRLKFTITNKPSWATFDENTGILTGKPEGHVAGTYSGISIRLTDWYGFVTLPTFSIVVYSSASVAAAAGSNTPPTINRTPAKALTGRPAYSFKPTAADANGNALKFSIANKPSWATFSTTTGALTGTATAAAVGTYANISISVSDG